MTFRLFTFAALCVLALALLFTLTPAVAQTATDNTPAAANDTTATLVPGTGMTLAELRDLGWSPSEIAGMQAPSSAPDTENQQAATNPDATQAGTNGTVADNTGGGKDWGLWGLVGLLGLLGLGGRRRRSEAAHDERDIRRIA